MVSRNRHVQYVVDRLVWLLVGRGIERQMRRAFGNLASAARAQHRTRTVYLSVTGDERLGEPTITVEIGVRAS